MENLGFPKQNLTFWGPRSQKPLKNTTNPVKNNHFYHFYHFFHKFTTILSSSQPTTQPDCGRRLEGLPYEEVVSSSQPTTQPDCGRGSERGDRLWLDGLPYEEVVILSKSGKSGKSCKSCYFLLDLLCFSMVSLILDLKKSSFA